MSFSKKYIELFTIVTILTGIVSCNRSEFSDFKEANGGMLYKIHESHGMTKAKIDDYVTVEMSYYTNEDSLLFDSKGQTFPLKIEKPVFAGDINDAMTLLGEGDSATFVIRADSFLIKNAKLNKLPAFVTKDSKIIFHVKLHEIQTIEELQAEKQRKIKMAKNQEAQKILDYIDQNNIFEIPDESGLYFILNHRGSGPLARSGDKVTVHYVGRFLDGTKFDSSYDRKKPVEFILGRGQVIKAWDIGISKMHVGDEATFIIPSRLGYGSGRGQIPPFTPLLFEVKLIDIK